MCVTQHSEIWFWCFHLTTLNICLQKFMYSTLLVSAVKFETLCTLHTSPYTCTKFSIEVAVLGVELSSVSSQPRKALLMVTVTRSVMLSSTCIDDCICPLFAYVVTVVCVLYLRTTFFSVITQQVWVIYYRRFRTNCQSYRQGRILWRWDR